jgi:hypothetical protein
MLYVDHVKSAPPTTPPKDIPMSNTKTRAARQNTIAREYQRITTDPAALTAVARALGAAERQGRPVSETDAPEYLADYASAVAMGQIPTGIDRPTHAAEWTRHEVDRRHRTGSTVHAAPRDPLAGSVPDAISDGVYDSSESYNGGARRGDVRSDEDAAAEVTRSLDIRAWAPVAVGFRADGSPERVGPEDPRHPCHGSYADVRAAIVEDVRTWVGYAARKPSPAALAVLASRAHPHATPLLLQSAVEEATGAEVTRAAIRQAVSRARREGEPKSLRDAFDTWAYGQLQWDRALAEWVGAETVSGPPADRFDALSAEVGSALATAAA